MEQTKSRAEASVKCLSTIISLLRYSVDGVTIGGVMFVGQIWSDILQNRDVWKENREAFAQQHI